MFAFAGLRILAPYIAIAMVAMGGLIYHFTKVSELKSALEHEQQSVAKLTKENTALVAVNLALAAENKGFKIMVEEHNSRIEKFKDSIAANIKASESALKRAEEEAVKWKSRIGVVLDAKPYITDNPCLSLERTFNNYLKIRWEGSL